MRTVDIAERVVLPMSTAAYNNKWSVYLDQPKNYHLDFEDSQRRYEQTHPFDNFGQIAGEDRGGG